MIHGATIRRASARRKSTDRTTIPVSQTHAGIARTRAAGTALATKPHLAQAGGELVRIVETDVRPGACDRTEHGVVHAGASGRELERLHVELRDPLQSVLPLHVLERAFGEVLARSWLAEQRERGFERPCLPLVDRHPERDAVRKLGEPATSETTIGFPSTSPRI